MKYLLNMANAKLAKRKVLKNTDFCNQILPREQQMDAKHCTTKVQTCQEIAFLIFKLVQTC